MNLPNKLTVSRLLLTVAFLIVFFARFPFADTVALIFFALAGLTDFLDGSIARRLGCVTTFGVLMDPLADKVLICSAFIAFVERGLMPAWMVVVVVARELAITGLRLLAAAQQVVLAAEGSGKHKTISQNVAIIAVLIWACHYEWGAWSRAFFDGWLKPFYIGMEWVAVALTLFSGTRYLWRNREIYLTDR